MFVLLPPESDKPFFLSMATATRPRHAKAADFIIRDEEEMIGSEVLSDENQAMGKQERGGEGQREEDENQEHHDRDGQDQGKYNSDTSEDQDNVEPAVLEDMKKFMNTFQGMSKRFRLINRIGEGTFSTVYKAEDLLYDEYENEYWDLEEKENHSQWASPPLKKTRAGSTLATSYEAPRRRKPKYVAIKKIYVTSSPMRIMNELELLKDLRGCDSVSPIITAFRHQDQVVAILPYFRHSDFREYFRRMTVNDIRIYFRSLFTALAAVHAQGIIHRDIKPTNFLYEPEKRQGVLVDFGLAEREGTDCKPCLCEEDAHQRRRRAYSSLAAQTGPATGYPKNDTRPSRRANRAGTRGFRAPEVLFKCTAQTTVIDIWSAGVILLTILSKRFPFFNSTDDIEAMIEISTIFGVKRMKVAALLHGTIFETNIPTIGEKGFSFEKIILWSTCRNEREEADGGKLNHEEAQAVAFLERCLDLSPETRITAREALDHNFLREDSFQDDCEAEMGEEEEIDLIQ